MLNTVSQGILNSRMNDTRAPPRHRMERGREVSWILLVTVQTLIAEFRISPQLFSRYPLHATIELFEKGRSCPNGSGELRHVDSDIHAPRTSGRS